MKLFQQWNDAENQSERFLGDEVKCYRLELTQGQTRIMPSGWIHAIDSKEAKWTIV